MAKVSTSISIDTEVKDKAIPILSELGLDLSTAVGIFLRQTIRERGLPFDVTLNTPNETTMAALEASMRNDDISGPFNSTKELMEALNA